MRFDIYYNLDSKTMDTIKDVSCKYIYGFDSFNLSIKHKHLIYSTLIVFESL